MTDIPLGKIQHKQLVGPVLDSVEVQQIVKALEKGDPAAMISLVLHNQMILGERIARLLEIQPTKNEKGKRK